MAHLCWKQWLKLSPPPLVAATSQCTKCITVIALATTYHVDSIGLIDFEEILTGQLQSRLDGLTSAADKIHLLNSVRCMFYQNICEFLCRLGSEKTGVGKSQFLKLLASTVNDCLRCVPETAYSGTTARVEIAFSLGIQQIDSITRDGCR